MYDNWETDADHKAEDQQEGWEAMQDILAEDEAWAQHLYESFYGREY